MSKHLFRLVFGAFFLVAATAFTGCSDDDDKSLTPKLTADPTALDFTDETATTQTVAITANCEWTVTASNLDWATISPMSGKGNGTISVTVSELPAGTNLREGKISFTLIHPEFGKWGQAESSVAVKQYGSGVTPPPTGDAIAEVIAGSVGATYTTQGQVVAINGRSFLIQDNSGKILVYLGWKDNKPVVDYSATIGQTVKVTGKTTTYSKLVQFSETDLVIEKVSDGSFTQPTPEKFDGAAFNAYLAATPVIKYIEYSGTLTIDGYYYNIAVDGTDLQGSLAYPADGFVDASLNGQVVIVKGYTLGMTNQSKMLSTIAVSVEKDGDAPAEPKITKLDPTSLSFAATDNAKTVTVTAANADDCTIEAATDKSEQFTTSVNGMVVTVTPKENTTEQAITATLTIKLMKAGAAVDTKTVAISQAGKSGAGGDGQQITLTLDDIIAIGGKSGAYAKFTYTNTFGEWSGKAAGGSSGKECLQINVKDNSAFGSFVQIPAVDGTIEKIEVTIREPYKGRAIGIFPVGYTYTKDTLDKMKEQLAKDAIAISNETPSDVNNNEPFTFVIDNLSAKNLTQFSIFPTLGAVSITAITVTYSK